MTKGNCVAYQPWNSATNDLSAKHWGCLADLALTPLPEGAAQPAGFPRGKLVGTAQGPLASQE